MAVISEPSKKRLLRLVQLLAQERKQYPTKKKITSREIEELTGWTNATIRRDISLLEVKCGSSNGYNMAGLYNAINLLFGLDGKQPQKKCCIVGLGRIGSALLDYDGFDNSSFRLVAGFDSNVNRTEILNASFPLYPTTRLEAVIKEQQIEYALLSVTEDQACTIATRLAEAGIKGIVNYTSAVLSVPETTAVENVSVISALQKLI